MSRRLIARSAAIGSILMFAAVLAATMAVAADASSPAKTDTAAPDPAALVQRACVGCHALEVVTGQGRTAKEWSDIVDIMADRGVDATPAELDQIKAYLAKTAPPASR
jgi:mono/diheme cytochrome c family protein